MQLIRRYRVSTSLLVTFAALATSTSCRPTKSPPESANSILESAGETDPSGRPPQEGQCEVDSGFAFTTAGTRWPNQRVSASFMLDGTPTGTITSTLFSKLYAVAPRAVWQREYARALATWAEVTNLNFRFVSDAGIATVTNAPGQADPRFGDIRIGTRDMGTSTTGLGYYPQSTGSNGGARKA